jgi:catalase
MPHPTENHTRRHVLTTVGRLSISGTIGTAMATSGFVARSVAAPADFPPAEKAVMGTENTATAAVDALEGAYGTHSGRRRNHIKGVGALGSFVGLSEGSALSRSALFSGQRIEVVARFSVAGGDPKASDAERSARGLALEFRLPNGALHHMTMINTPMFFAAVPATFLDKFIAQMPDPTTGKPNSAKLAEFVARHAESAGQAKFLQINNPPPSFANCAFYGIHTFKFIDRRNRVTMVKFRFVPQDGEKQLGDAELEMMPRDFLSAALTERLHRGAALWDMILTIGEPGDEEDDPTVLWPANRREVKVGTLTVSSAAPDEQAGSYNISFDPLMLDDGIAPTDDPVLLFRSPSYATSHTRRLQEV